MQGPFLLVRRICRRGSWCRQRRPRCILERLAHILGLGTLLRAQHVVASDRELAGAAVVGHDMRTQEDHQVGLLAGLAVGAEQRAQHGHLRQRRHLVVAGAPAVLDQAAEHHQPAVAHHHLGLDGAPAGGRSARAAGAGHRGRFLEEGQPDLAVGADLRLDAQRDAHVLALDGLERIRGGAAGVAAGHEGHVLADDDLGLLVVQRHDVGVAQDVAAGLRLQRRGDGAQRHRRQRRGADAQDLRPLHADVAAAAGIDLGHQRLDVDLRAALVELVDHGADVAPERLGRGDDQRVAGRIGLDGATGGGRGRGGHGRTGLGRRAAAPRAAAAAACGGGWRCGRRGAGRTAGTAARSLLGRREGRPQHGGQPGGLGMLQVDDMHPAAGAAGLVQPRHQRAHPRQPGGIGRTHQQRIERGVGQHQGGRGAAGRRGRGAAARIEQLLHRGGQHGGLGVLQRDHLDVGRAGRVQRGDQRAQARQVARVVGDDQRVGAGVDVDGVVRADQRAQHGEQVARVLVLDRDDLRDDGVALGGAAGRDRHPGLQPRLGLGHDATQALGLDHRIAQAPQCGHEQRPGPCDRHRLVGVERDLAAHARIDQQRAPGHGAHRAGAGLDVGVGKPQRDVGRTGRAGGGRSGGGAGMQAEQGRQRGRGNKASHGRALCACRVSDWCPECCFSDLR